MFFEKTFLVANIGTNAIFRISFSILNNTNVDFSKKKPWWGFYIIEKTFFTTNQVKLIGTKEFIAATLDLRYRIFIVYIAFFNNLSNNKKCDIYLFCKI